MSFLSNISFVVLGSIITLLSGLIFLTYRQRQIQKEFEKFNSLDELRDQMEQFKKSFSGNNFSKEIDSMMKNFEEDDNKKEKVVEIKGKKDSSKEEE
ncbi:MAG: Phosphatidylglycerol--prolipoprotein diacylglyceryl transferase [Mycoplasmataceae bacterium]|nr:MAG: Phosphatidylglycerol--prolipoprotein diacylglyceryl transferase [Mycoplasmataceae bacterium]